MDVWNYIRREQIEVPSLYLAHKREVIWRNDSWIPNSEFLILGDKEKIETKKVRFRTLGDITITGGIESEADTLEKIVQEVSSMKKPNVEIEVMISDRKQLWKIEKNKGIFKEEHCYYGNKQ